jgi:DNA-binding GntR family transcriptional regulator
MSEVYAAVFERVVSGQYQADERLKEEELAGEFGVSRTPVRDALRQLAEDGLVEILPKRGARVVGFTVDDVEEIYEIRKSLELQALRNSAPTLSIQGLKSIRDELLALGDTSDIHLHEAADAKLHNFLIDSSGKKRLKSILSRMFRLIQRFRELGFTDPQVRKTALKTHLDLVDALSMRDLERAEGILVSHIDESKKNAIAQIIKGE